MKELSRTQADTSKKPDYEVVVIGAGPSGLFTCLELIGIRPDTKILLIDKGRSLEKRVCPLKEGKTKECIRCHPCHTLCGWGGAGAYSDGKLTLTPEYGGNLAEYIGRERLVDLLEYVDKLYRDYGADVPLYEPDPDLCGKVSKTARIAGLQLIPSKIRHLGTDRSKVVLANIYDALKDKIDILFNAEVGDIINEDGQVKGISLANGDFIPSKIVVIAPGREGAAWIERVCKKNAIKTRTNPVDIGVRVEIPAEYAEHLTDNFYELKLVYNSRSFDDKIRTFCMCPHGEVVSEFQADGSVLTVNGHSFRDIKTENTNFAVLVSTTFTEPFSDPNGYGTHIARLANMLGGSVIVQRLGDLQAGRRSTKDRINRGLVRPTLLDSMPGDLSFVFPYRHLRNIIEMMEALDKVIPGVNGPHTLLYGVEVKFYSLRLHLSEQLETNIDNLFAIGDGAGVTRGLIQASSSGVVVSRIIADRLH